MGRNIQILLDSVISFVRKIIEFLTDNFVSETIGGSCLTLLQLKKHTFTQIPCANTTGIKLLLDYFDQYRLKVFDRGFVMLGHLKVFNQFDERTTQITTLIQTIDDITGKITFLERDVEHFDLLLQIVTESIRIGRIVDWIKILIIGTLIARSIHRFIIIVIESDNIASL